MLHEDGFITQQQRDAAQPVQLGSTRERVARDCDVMIAENDQRSFELQEEPDEQWHAARVGDQVTGDADEIGLPLRNPGDGPLGRHTPTRGRPQVEVGQVRDPDSLQLCRQPRNVDVEHTPAQPSRLEPRVDKRAEAQARDSDDCSTKHRSTLVVTGE